MLHLALKAFYPAPPPFPLLHVDTTWKFRDDVRVARPRWRASSASSCSSTRTRRRSRRASTRSPRLGAAHRHVEDEGLKQALDKYGFDAAFGGARRDEEKSRAKERIFSLPLSASTAGTRRTSAPSCGASTTPASTRARASACSRCRTGPSSTSGSTSTCENIPIVPLYFAARAPGGRARRHADHGRRRAHAAASPARRR